MLVEEQNRSPDTNGEVIRHIEAKLEDAYEMKEMYWKEKFELIGCNGDNNTKFFHSKVQTRNRKNKISRLEDEDGEFKTDSTGIVTIAQLYFEALFSTSNPKDSTDDLEDMP
ncbi:hypothetical protein AAHE18_14G208100 [Arachis hypogaea]|nr:Reverse transcriptase, putative [Arachis hypogaea]